MCMNSCLCHRKNKNNGIVVMMLIVVSVVGVGTESRVVLVIKLLLFDGQWEVDVGRTAI